MAAPRPEVPHELYTPDGAPIRPAEGPDASTWLALVVLGALLFAGGVVIGLALAGTIPSALGHNPWAVPAPFALTVAGGALAMYCYERWHQHPDGPGGKQRRRGAVEAMPSFTVFSPPRDRER